MLISYERMKIRCYATDNVRLIHQGIKSRESEKPTQDNIVPGSHLSSAVLCTRSYAAFVFSENIPIDLQTNISIGVVIEIRHLIIFRMIDKYVPNANIPYIRTFTGDNSIIIFHLRLAIV